MATTNYHTVNGEIIGETTSAVRTGYLTDGLGSVTATQGSTGNVLATYRYKPYGSLLAKTGAGSDPRFLWVGSRGYRASGVPQSSRYIRFRHYDINLGSWTTVQVDSRPRDLYTYVGGSPTSRTDSFGLEQDPLPGKKVCFTSKPTIVVRAKNEECSEMRANGLCSQRIFLDIKATCHFSSYGSYWLPPQYFIPQWKEGIVDGRSIDDSDGNLWNNCNRARPNHKKLDCIAGICVVETWGVDGPGPAMEEPYPQDCSLFKPYTSFADREIGTYWNVTFTTCCSCEGYWKATMPPKPPADPEFLKQCQKWRMWFTLKAPGDCAIGFELIK